jgi:hypothetical protein
MHRSRRELIKTAVVATAGILLPGRSFGGERRPAARAGRPETRRSAWADRIGGSFSVERPDGRRVELRLRGVTDLASAETAGLVGHERAFSLVFEGPGRHALPQGTYDIWGFTHGWVALFLVPVDIPQGRQRYEVIFNNAIS